MTNPKCYHLSASSIAAFKTCPMKFRLNYREGLRKVEDTDSQRVGTNWHKMHEVYANDLGASCRHEDSGSATAPLDPNDHAIQAVVTLLNDKYTGTVPPTKTETEWALEREVLFQSFLGYLWRWSTDPIQFLASELAFNLPLVNPRVGLPLPMEEVQRVGKIDHIIRWQGMVGGLERKSTSRSIAPDSDYWEKGKKDTQVSQYALAVRDMVPYANSLTAALFGPFFELPLSRGRVALVDETDRELVSGIPWHLWEEKYAATNIKDDADQWVAVRLHQFLIGEIEPGEVIDHINGDGLDNRRCNLRVVTQHVNRLNANTRGTSFHRGADKWVARITLGGHTKSLGYFPDEPSAHAAYVRAKADVLPDPYANFGNCLYDVWHKPTIKPTDLTQAETKEFLATGDYCGQKFQTQWYGPDRDHVQLEDGIKVDNIPVEITPGKKGFAIKESVAMFGARLLQDIYARPDFYYQRREIVRTDEELREFQEELFAIYQAQKAFERNNCYFSNESQCRATFACPNIPICYGPGAKAVCDGHTTPNGFKRIFVDLTVRGQDVEE